MTTTATIRKPWTSPADAETADPDDYKRLCDEYLSLIHAHGIASVYEQWEGPLVNRIADAVDAHDPDKDIDLETLTRLAFSMRRDALRDALIINAIAHPTREQLRILVDRPRSQEAREVTETIMTAAYHGIGGGPDPDRIGTTLTILARASAAATHDKAQPDAAMAYLLWWTGDDCAEEYARKAIREDRTRGLAHIVLKAIEKGMRPAYDLQ